jgi:hypothetical protein
MEPLRISRRRDVPEAGPRPLAPVDLAPLVGTWVNFDFKSRGIARLELAEKADGLTVRIFGDAYWGEVPAFPFTDGVGLHEAVAFNACYDFGGFGGMKVTLACYLNKRLLVVDAYTTFNDGSGRSPYFARDHFYIP